MSKNVFIRSKILRLTARIVFSIVFVYGLTTAMIFFDRTSYNYFPDKTDFYDCNFFTDSEK